MRRQRQVAGGSIAAREVHEARPAGVNTTADRTLDVLLSFTQARPTWPASELAAHLGMPRSTLYRYLGSLRSSNLVVEEQGGRYRLGPRILELARVMRHATSVLQLALPPMRALEERFGEIVVLKERVGLDIVNLESLPGRHRITLTATQSQMLPWPAAPSAKVFAAFAESSDWAELTRLMRPVAFTASTVPDLPALEAQLAAIRERGVAIGLEELDEGVRGVAAPIFEDGRCRYTLSVAAPSFRLTDALLPEVAEAFRLAAIQVTAGLKALSGHG